MTHSALVTTGGHYEYLKIAEGCDKHCTPHQFRAARTVPRSDGGTDSRSEDVAEQVSKSSFSLRRRQPLWYRSVRKAVSTQLKSLPFGALLDSDLASAIGGHLSEPFNDEEPKSSPPGSPIQHASHEILRRMGRRTSKQADRQN